VSPDIEASVVDGFQQVGRLHALGMREIGDGAGDLENAKAGTGGEFQARHRIIEQAFVLLRKLAMSLQYRVLQASIDVAALFELHGAAGNHLVTYLRA